MELRDYNNQELWELYNVGKRNNSGSLKEMEAIIVERYKELTEEDIKYIAETDRWSGGGKMCLEMVYLAAKLIDNGYNDK